MILSLVPDRGLLNDRNGDAPEGDVLSGWSNAVCRIARQMTRMHKRGSGISLFMIVHDRDMIT